MSEELNSNEEYLLIKFSDCYSDEFDIRGFAVMTTQQWNQYQEAVKRDQKLEYCFGTNEEVNWYSAEDCLGCFKISSISYDEAKMFCKHFEKKFPSMEELRISYGFFPYFRE